MGERSNYPSIERRMSINVGRILGSLMGLALLTAAGCGPPKTDTTQSAVDGRRGRPQPASYARSTSSRDDFDLTRVPGRIHTIERNETLWSLSQRYYGHGKHWRKILVANRNRLSNSTELPQGMKLIIP